MKLQVPYEEIDKNIEILDKLFSSYSVVNRIERLYNLYNPDDILYTSSFGADAAYLLHLINRICPSQKVHFINTGYHFKETIEYMNKLKDLFDLEIIEILPEKEEHNFTNEKELWKSQPNKCCHINKVKPLEGIDKKYKVWLSGLKSNQSELRSSLKIFENKNNIIKFHPIYDQTQESISKYLDYFNLPVHPLKIEGYHSIGCFNCTAKGQGRDGRWSGSNKTECGLHFDVNL